MRIKPMTDEESSTRLEVICVESPDAIIGGWLVTLIILGFVGGALVLMWEVETDVVPWIIFSAFAAIGLFMLASAIRTTWGRFKFGNVRLWLENPLLERGGHLIATVTIPSRLREADFVMATLACKHCQRYPNDGNYVEDPVWRLPRRFPLRRDGGAIKADFDFKIPVNSPATNLPGETHHGDSGGGFRVSSGESYYAWELKVEVDVPGLDLERTYRIFVS